MALSDLSCAFSILKNLYLKNRNFCSTDYDQSLHFLSKILPFTIHSYSEPFNTWQIPPKWDLIKGEIRTIEGKKVFSVDHPLKIIGLSKPINQRISKKKLLQHLHYDHRYKHAIPYHFRQFYRPWDRDWGFCVSKSFYNSLNEKSYDVEIITKEEKGALKIADYNIKGASSCTFAFVAHLDHPGMANDDLAGVAVGVELFRRLKQLKTKFSYRLILVPEIIGSEFYLGQKENRSPIFESCFLEMLGSNTPLSLQLSLNQNTAIESCLLASLKATQTPFNQGPFKTIICNDESIFEGYKIPMCSLSRFPYPQYHTSLDNLAIIKPSYLEESIQVLWNTIERLEQMTLIEKKFTGTPCLSHPSLNLYVDPGQRAFGTHQNKNILQQRMLMDLIPIQNQFFFLEKLAEQVNLDLSTVLLYLKSWEKANLIQIF